MTFANLFPVLCFSQSMFDVHRNQEKSSEIDYMSWDHCDLRFLSTYQTNQSTVTDKYRALPTYRLAFRWSIFDRHVTSQNAWTSSINVNLQFIPSYFKRSLVGFISIRPANQMIKFPPVAETPYELDFTTANLRIWEYAFWRFCPPFCTCSVLAVFLFLRDL